MKVIQKARLIILSLLMIVGSFTVCPSVEAKAITANTIEIRGETTIAIVGEKPKFTGKLYVNGKLLSGNLSSELYNPMWVEVKWDSSKKKYVSKEPLYGGYGDDYAMPFEKGKKYALCMYITLGYDDPEPPLIKLSSDLKKYEGYDNYNNYFHKIIKINGKLADDCICEQNILIGGSFLQVNRGYFVQTAVEKKNIVPAITIKSLTASKKAFTVKFPKVNGVSGYQVRYSTQSSMKSSKTVTISGSKNTSKKVKNLKKKKNYYVQVRTYRDTGSSKIYGSWSKIKSIKTK